MPNGYDYSKEYGPHKYGGDGTYTVDCEYGCGCSMGTHMSHGRGFLDPGGECPGNPVNGELLGGERDYHVVVMRRIKKGEAQGAELRRANRRIQELEDLAGRDKLELEQEVNDKNVTIGRLTHAISKAQTVLYEIFPDLMNSVVPVSRK